MSTVTVGMNAELNPAQRLHALGQSLWLDYEGLHATCVRQVQLVREAGVLSELPIHLSTLGIACAWIGDFAAAASLIMEAENVAAATGSRLAPFAALRLRGLQGREAEASPLLASAIELAAAKGGRGRAH